MRYVCNRCADLFSEDEIIVVGADKNHFQLYLCGNCWKELKDKLVEKEAQDNAD